MMSETTPSLAHPEGDAQKDITLLMRSGHPQIAEGDDCMMSCVAAFCQKHGRSPRIFNVGCGSGYLAWKLANAFPEADMVAHETDPTLLEALLRRVSDTRVRIFTKPFDEWHEPIDLLIRWGSYHHLPESYIAHARSVLANSGRFLLGDEFCPEYCEGEDAERIARADVTRVAGGYVLTSEAELHAHQERTVPLRPLVAGVRDNFATHYIDGQAVPSISGRRFPNLHPASGLPLGEVALGEHDDVDRAVAAAARAFEGPWGSTRLSRRIAALEAVARGIETDADAFVAAEVADSGRPRSMAEKFDVPRASENLRTYARIAASLPGESLVEETPDGAAIGYTLRVPLGVVGLICPWNLPLALLTWKLGPALAAGNTVVVKPSEETPSTATLLGHVIKEAGIPDGVYNVVHGSAARASRSFGIPMWRPSRSRSRRPQDNRSWPLRRRS